MTDLLVLAALTRATWPLAASWTPSGSLAQALDHDLTRPGPAPSLRISTAAHKRWDSDVFSARGTAALLVISARILNLPLPELRLELRRLIAQIPPRDDIAWGHTWLTLRRDSSPLFRHEVLQLLDQRFPARYPLRSLCPRSCGSAGAATRRKQSPSASPQNGRRSSQRRSATGAARPRTSRSAGPSQRISFKPPRAWRCRKRGPSSGFLRNGRQIGGDSARWRNACTDAEQI